MGDVVAIWSDCSDTVLFVGLSCMAWLCKERLLPHSVLLTIGVSLFQQCQGKHNERKGGQEEHEEHVQIDGRLRNY